MKSAEEILRVISSVCRKFPDLTCVGCICNADLAAIRAAQIDAAEWMREEAVEAVRLLMAAADTDLARDEELYDAIRAIKLPGETI